MRIHSLTLLTFLPSHSITILAADFGVILCFECKWKWRMSKRERERGRKREGETATSEINGLGLRVLKVVALKPR